MIKYKQVFVAWSLFFLTICGPIYLTSQSNFLNAWEDDWQSVSVQYYFSPDDHLQERLIALIDQETVSIKAAVFLVTDIKIVKALMKAYDRGVEVQLVVDTSQSRGVLSKIELLRKHGIFIFEYDARNEFYNLMHNKFAIFKRQNLVWTGSYNWTKAANEKNQENVIVIKSTKVVARFSAQFELLKTRCYI